MPLKERLKGRLKRLLNRKVSEGSTFVNHGIRSLIPHSQTMATTQAQQAVFNTYELLEHVLLHLPLTTLILINRVCRYWHDIINGSIDIQRALFLAPMPTSSETAVANPFFVPILAWHTKIHGMARKRHLRQ